MYRPLNEGEIEISSSGVAQAFFSADGDLSLRGGMSCIDMQNTELRIISKTGTFYRRGALVAGDTLIDQERLGVVRRGENKFEDGYVKTKDRFAKEYLRIIHADADTPLVDYREGDVYDNQGVRITHSTTNKNLRARAKYYTDSGSVAQAELDVDGNFSFSLPTTANKGMTLSVPEGQFKVISGSAIMQIAQGLSISTGKDVSINIGSEMNGSFRVKACEDVRLDSKVRIEIYCGQPETGAGGTIHLRADQIFLNDRVVQGGNRPI